MDLKLLPNNAMTFTENQHGNAVLEKLRQQRELVRFCDVIIHVDGKQFQAHRCVLSACSPFFDSLFKGNKAVKEQCKISADNCDAFQILLAYMYTGTVIVDKKNVSELLKLADKFLLSKLKDYCAEYLQRYLDSRNCLTVLEMANKYCLESLQRIVNGFISHHLLEVIEGEEIMKLSLPRLENFIKCSTWQLSNEEMLGLIISWVGRSLEERESNCLSLLTWISWKDIKPEHVIHTIQEHPLFESSRKCRSFILEVLNENNLLCQPGFDELCDLRTMDEQNGGAEEDNDKFLNLAISTAIDETLLNEPNVDKYLIETGRELLRSDFAPSDQSHFELRDLNPIKNEADYHQHSTSLNLSNLQTKSNLVDSFNFPSNYAQNIDIEELCKYTIENTQKQKPLGLETFEEEQEQYGFPCKPNEYENGPYVDQPPNCYHYRDYRDDHFSSHNVEKCPKMRNKVSYMNHKYDANYSTQFSSVGDLNYNPKCGDLNTGSFQMDLTKDYVLGVVDAYSNEHNIPGLSMGQDAQFQNVPLITNAQNKDQGMIEPGICDSQNVFHGNFNLNSFSDFKPSSFPMASTQADVLCMGYSSDTETSSNYPQDMSLNHLKLTECGNAPSVLHDNKDKVFFEESQIPTESEIVDSCSGEFRSCPGRTVGSEPLNSRYEESLMDETVRLKEKLNDTQVTEEDPDLGENENTGSLENQSSQIPRKQTKPRRKEKKREKSVSEEGQQGTPKTKKNLKAVAKEKGSVEVKKCQICDTSFDRKMDYFAHMVTHFPGPPHQCIECSSTFKRIYYLVDHLKTHSDGKPFKCQICPFQTRRMFNLKDHMELHNNLRPFECDICGLSFRRKPHLDVHLTKHSKSRPFACNECDWTGKTSNSLLLHAKVHNGDLHSCKVPGCSYKTSKISHLKEHMQFHSKSRPFECEKCEKRFVNKSHLQRHRLLHDPKAYSRQCPHCDYSAPRLDTLKKHIKRKHTSSEPAARSRKGPVKKKDGFIANVAKKDAFSNAITNEQTLSTLNTSGGSPNPGFPNLSSPLSHYHTQPTSPSQVAFEASGDPDDPLTIVSEMEDGEQSLSTFNQSAYLDPISQPFPGLPPFYFS